MLAGLSLKSECSMAFLPSSSLSLIISPINLSEYAFHAFHKSQKGLPLETKNAHNHENRRLGLIESLHMQLSNLRGWICPLAPA